MPNKNTFLNSSFRWKCNKFVAQGIAILGYFFNEPTKGSLIGEKSSLIGEKLSNLVTLQISQEFESRERERHTFKLFFLTLSFNFHSKFILSRAQFYKPFYGHNIQMFEII
jgi:hypothetical protein